MSRSNAPLVQSEAELCAAFIDEFNRVPGWTCYPETAGFDILVVHAEGRQIGVEAKLQLNAKVAAQRDPATMLDLFAQVLGMANAVAENCRAMVELILIERGEHPHTAEQANLPTMFGALQGVVLAATVNPRGTCAGCAYRLGTPANTSPVTTSDAIYCRQELSRFYCHADLDDQGNPVRTCVGHAKAMKQDAAK
nr:hypothetical protein [Pseudomonas aeruginosa]